MTAINKAVLVSPIAEEVMLGLNMRPRCLPPKLFYDAAGSRLFDEITETPEYYPTRTERAILQEFAGAMVQQAGNNLTLVELGAGSASKTHVLIHALLRRQLRADFYPVDVSSSALQGALASLNGHFPRLRVSPIVADYTHHLPDLKQLAARIHRPAGGIDVIHVSQPSRGAFATNKPLKLSLRSGIIAGQRHGIFHDRLFAQAYYAIHW